MLLHNPYVKGPVDDLIFLCLTELTHDGVSILVCCIDIPAEGRIFVNTYWLKHTLRLSAQDTIADEHKLLLGVDSVFAFVASLIWLFVFTVTATAVK